MTPRRVLVAGASGVVGRAALEAFAAASGWDVLGLSRRAPDDAGQRHLPLDLRDARACAAALRAQPAVTHVVYCARSRGRTQHTAEVLRHAAREETARRTLEAYRCALSSATWHAGSGICPRTPACPAA